MTEEQRAEIKKALIKCAEENEGKNTFTGYVIVSSVCKAGAERIAELEAHLTKAKELLKQWLQTSNASSCDNINIVTDTEQFLKEVEK